jgi:hypothetical protein
LVEALRAHGAGGAGAVFLGHHRAAAQVAKFFLTLPSP